MPKRRLAMVAGLAALVVTLPAMAQTGSVPYDTNIDFQQFRPAPGPYNFFTVQGSRVEGRTALSVGAWVNYGYRPLTIFNAVCPSATNDSGCTVGDVRSRPIEHLATLNLLVGVTLANRILLTLDLPFTYESGQAVERESGRPLLDPSSNVLTQSAGGLGDPRVEAKVRLAGSGLTGAGLAVSGFVTVPIGRHAGTGDHFVADRSATFGGRIIGEYRRGRFSVALNLGAVGRPNTLSLLSTEVGSRLTWGAAVGVDISPRLAVMAEGFGASDLTSQLQNNNAEVLGGVRYRIRDLTFTAGGGSGVLRGAGSPVARAFLGVGWAPYRVDNDNDGVGDNVDRCPTEAEDIDGYEDEDGCPEADNDGDGIDDASDRCPDEPEDRDTFQDSDGCPDPDNDNDGVPDGYDTCPREPEDRDGDHDEDGCPDNDRDRDGVPDDRDRCAGEPEDTDGFQDEDGCPDPDNDGDGIPDTEDQCSDQAGPASGHGCPAEVTPPPAPAAAAVPAPSGPSLAQIVGDQIQIRGSVNFARSRDRIEGAGSFQVLESVLSVLRAHPEITRVEVQGHTDNLGDAERNTALSERRAESVRRWLVEHGVDGGRLTARGLGPSQPIESNSTEAGRTRNRRVEFHIATPAAGPR
ncbi:MAG: OmpA family protein [Deltaproteobacteria bacterium]|nr:OmpA family protein [Myxococcales bacterium]MDP3220088.1 OmpA family protein [Deltaproteobacteria bacterium]